MSLEYRSNIQLKPYSFKELKSVYGVSSHVLRKWLGTIDGELGKREGGLYNIKQVDYIFNSFGVPGLEIIFN